MDQITAYLAARLILFALSRGDLGLADIPDVEALLRDAAIDGMDGMPIGRGNRDEWLISFGARINIDADEYAEFKEKLRQEGIARNS